MGVLPGDNLRSKLLGFAYCRRLGAVGFPLFSTVSADDRNHYDKYGFMRVSSFLTTVLTTPIKMYFFRYNMLECGSYSSFCTNIRNNKVVIDI